MVLLVALLFIFILLGFVVQYFNLWQGSPLIAFIGIKEYKDATVNFLSPPKTLWDLFGVIVIPVIVAIGVAYLQNSQKERELSIEDERSQDSRYREYLKIMESLILDRFLLTSQPPSSVCSLAQAYTRDVIKNLTGLRLGMLLDFLESYEFDLIVLENPVISLRNLLFKNADLTGLKLDDINLDSVIMKSSKWDNVTCSYLSAINAQFSNSSFDNASFNSCDFENTNFSRSSLKKVTFLNCNLSGAIFDSADLSGASFPQSDLSFVHFDKKTRLDYKWRVILETVLCFYPKPLLKAENLVDAVLAETDLSECDLSDADLTNANLSGADLQGANLTNARLVRANLTDAILDSHTRIENRWRLVASIMSSSKKPIPDLEFEDLSDAYLENANLQGARLRSARLVGADLMYANLQGADLRGADLESILGNEDDKAPLDEQEADWYILWTKVSRFLKRRFPAFWSRWLSRFSVSGGSFHDQEQTTLLFFADLRNAYLQGTELTNVELSRVKLHGAVIDEETKMDEKWKTVYGIVNSKVDVGTLENTDLSFADLSSTDLTAAVLDRSFMVGVNLSNATLLGASIINANLDDADLSEANLSNADLRRTTLSRANLHMAILKNAQLQGVNLTGVNFNEVDLSGANLTGAIVNEEDLKYANLTGTIMHDGNKKT